MSFKKASYGLTCVTVRRIWRSWSERSLSSSSVPERTASSGWRSTTASWPRGGRMSGIRDWKNTTKLNLMNFTFNTTEAEQVSQSLTMLKVPWVNLWWCWSKVSWKWQLCWNPTFSCDHMRPQTPAHPLHCQCPGMICWLVGQSDNDFMNTVFQTHSFEIQMIS